MTKPDRDRKRLLFDAASIAGPVVLAAALFAFALSTYPRLPIIGDSVTYLFTAQRLVDTGVFAYGSSEPNAIVTPGYPLFLGAFYAAAGLRSTEPTEAAMAVEPAVTNVQFLLSLCTVGLIAGSGFVLGGRRLALLSGFMAALYPPFAWSSSIMLGEALATALAAGQLLLALQVCGSSARRPAALLFGLGVVSAVLTLLRPIMALWIVVPFIYLAVRRLASRERLVRLAVASLLGLVLVMAPWWIRNAVTLHEFIPLSSGGGTVAFLATGGGELTPEEQRVSSTAEARGEDGLGAVAKARVSQQLRTDPGGLFAARGRQALLAATTPWSAFMDAGWTIFNAPEVARIEFEPFPARPTDAFLASLRFSSVYQTVLLVLGLSSLLFLKRSPRLAVVASVPVYTIGMYSLTAFISRYFLPAMPALIVLAAGGVYGGASLLRTAFARQVAGRRG